ncbi:unnamed protein product [Hydatigera taeniaeformis]|uniref:PHD domain-containing protein n=1 Tax=Hydatigena taeniaeformis TaxID=6205 RepID=A0A0R3WTA4_HYDTA|nr:unnamed protein product [Hydatigera taeniaeformis]
MQETEIPSAGKNDPNPWQCRRSSTFSGSTQGSRLTGVFDVGADDRSLRGALPSTASLASLDDVSTASPPLTPHTPSGFEVSAVGGATTGFQRWCNCVRSATTTAQLHLLLRALERSVRKANRGGRGVPAAIGSYATRFRLPEVRCTACRGPPDEASVSGGSGTVVTAFCLCGGCACPFHQDCLLNSLSRQSSRSLTSIRTNAYRGARTPDAAPITALSCLYSLMPCHINTTAAARQDCLKSALLLCQRCRRLAGGCEEDVGMGEKEHFAEPLPDELLEAVELQEVIDGGGGGQGVDEENDDEEEGEVVEGIQDREGEAGEVDKETSVRTRSITPTATRGRSSLNGLPMARRGHGRRSRGSFSLRYALGAGHRGRSAKRPRYLEDYEGDEMEEGGDQFYCMTMGTKATKTEDVYADADVLYEDEVEAYGDLKPRNKARRGGLSNKGTLTDNNGYILMVNVLFSSLAKILGLEGR